MTHQELKVILLKDPAFRAAYEAERQNPQSGDIMVMALKKWCLILVYQVQIYQLQLDEQA